MTERQLAPITPAYILPHADTPVLLALLRAWWTGMTVAQMATTHGLTARRVRDLLRRVGCRVRARRETAGAPDSRRPVPPQRVAEALAMLNHARFARLTAGQRAAVAWTASGLSSRDIAKRMGLTGQRVRMLFVAASQRLGRHPAPGSDSANGNTPYLPALCWEEILTSSTGPAPAFTENTHAD